MTDLSELDQGSIPAVTIPPVTPDTVLKTVFSFTQNRALLLK